MYVYGVVRAGVRLDLPPEGVAGGAVTRVEQGDLGALVGTIDEGPVKPSRRNVMAHSRVLQEVVAHAADVLPMRFGVVMPNADAVRDELLALHDEVLRAQLHEHAGRVELTVTVTSPQEDQLRMLLGSDLPLRRAAGDLDRATPSERIAFGEQIARAIEVERERVARRVIAAVSDFAVDAAVDEPRHDDMLANVAFLVERQWVAAFDGALDELGREFGPGRRVRAVGPMPPYHFVELALDQEAGAWA